MAGRGLVEISSDEKRIQALLTPTTQDLMQEVSFTAFYDNPKQEKAWRGFKLAAEEIAYLEPALAIKVAYAQMEKFATFLVERCAENTSLDAVRTYVKDVLLQLVPYREERDTKKLYDFLFTEGGKHVPVFPPLAQIVDGFKDLSSHPGTQFAFYRYVAAFRGLAMNAAMTCARIRFMEKVQNNSPRMREPVIHPIVERKPKISKGKNEALLEISEMDHVLVFSLAIATIQNMISIVGDDQSRVATKEALLAAKQILASMRDRLDKPFADHIIACKENQDVILQDLAKLAVHMRAIQPSQNLLQTAVELSTYLCGMYLQAYNRQHLPAYLPYSQNDATLKKATGGKLSMLIIAKHYEDASLVIGEIYRTLQLPVVTATGAGHSKFAPPAASVEVSEQKAILAGVPSGPQ
jgi:hypothetical protein